MSDLHRSIPKQDVPTRDQIAQRAYELYQNRGSEPGRDVEDWLAAERELRNQNSSSTSAPLASNEKQGSFIPSRQRQAKARAASSSSSFEAAKPVDHQGRSKEF